MDKLIKVKRGDIIWLSEETPIFLLGDNVQYTDRPYMVISNNTNNEKAPTINVACISKQVRKSRYPMHVFLSKNKYDLKYNSLVFTEQIFTINKTFVKEKVGQLDQEDETKLNKALFVQLIDENPNTVTI